MGCSIVTVDFSLSKAFRHFRGLNGNVVLLSFLDSKRDDGIHFPDDIKGRSSAEARFMAETDRQLTTRPITFSSRRSIITTNEIQVLHVLLPIRCTI
jgi:hypothetical protein